MATPTPRNSGKRPSRKQDVRGSHRPSAHAIVPLVTIGLAAIGSVALLWLNPDKPSESVPASPAGISNNVSEFESNPRAAITEPAEFGREFPPSRFRPDHLVPLSRDGEQPPRTSRPGHSHAYPAAFLATLSDEDLIASLPEEERRSLRLYREKLETSDLDARPYICWSPGTAPEIVEAYRRVEQEFGLATGKARALATQFLGIGHWSETATNGSGQGIQGLPVTVTWSVVPDGTDAPDRDDGAAAPSNLQAWLAGIYGTAGGGVENQPWFPLFQEAFDNIAAQSGLNFVYEPNDDGLPITSFSNSPKGVLGVRGDIRLSARAIDGNFGTLAFAYSPNHGDVVIDSTDGYFNTTSSNSIRFVNTITHELGHSVGLGHVCPINQTKLMEPFLTTSFRGCQFDDTYSLQRQYADELEVHSGLRNNDSAGNATPISPTPGVTSNWRWLSNDDSGDVDYLRFSGVGGQSLTVRVIPSDPIAPSDPNVDTYLEGPQNTDGTCSSGSDFDPTTRQDLALELLDGNGSTVLVSSTSAPAGETESITGFVLPADGNYYLRINGGSADASQLYELEVLVEDPPPAPRLQVDSTRLIAESNSGGNGAADPGETIFFGVTVTNVGDLPATNLVATLTGPTGFVPFSTTDGAASLAVSTSSELQFLFSPDGACGDTIELSLAAGDDSGYSDTLSIPLVLGVATEAALFDENFDSSPSLPAGWTQSTTGGGSSWAVSSANADSAPNAAFSAAVSSVGDAYLVSPGVVLGNNGATLTFRHSFDLQSGRDGGVLEASLDGGAWFDLVESPAPTVTAGGYTSSIGGGGPPQSRPSIYGRNAWSGSSAGFITSSIALPAAWASQTIQLRWRLAHNSGTAGTGWYVDSVNLSGGQIFTCDPFRPTFTLSASDTILSEGDGTSTLDLTLATSLPLATDVSVTPLISGTADAGDLDSTPSFTLVSGSTSTVSTVSAATDSNNEGTEEITFSLPTSDPGFAAGSPSSATVSIEEGLLTATVILSDLATVYNGGQQGVTVTTDPAGLATSVTYDGSTTEPTNAGTYAVSATITEPGYTGSATDTFIISPDTATVTLGDLAQTYDGDPKPATATTDPAGLAVAITYDGNSTAPNDAGSYAVVATVTDPNYTGTASDTLVIAPAAATVTLADLAQTYDGDPKPANATTDPAGLSVAITYDGGNTAPTDAGSYAVVATITDPNYTGTASGTLVIAQAAATVTLADLAQTYDGNPKTATATSEPAGLTVAITYDGNSTAPSDAGSYAVVATVTDPNYTGSASSTLVISPAAATVTLGDLAQTYDANPKLASATTDPAGLAVAISYDGGATAPTDAGSYAVVATVTDPNYSGTASDTLVIAPAAATVTLADLAQTYDGDPKPANAATDPAGLAVTVTYDGNSTAPTDAGTYAVVANITDLNYTGSASGTLVIAQAAATVTLADLAQTYDGNPKPASATTDPEGIAVAITYDGGNTAPTDAGSYPVVATVTDPNYTGSASSTLVISPAAATVTLGDLAQTYDANPKPATATTDPAGLAVAITYDGGATVPTGAGSYAVVATVTDPNHTGTASGTLVIAQAAATVTLGALAQTYDGNPKPATATTDPEGLAVTVTYDGNSTAPTDAGSYPVVATVTDPNYTGSASSTLVISPAAATVTLGDLAQTYDANPKLASATTDPAGLAVAITYDGGATAPTDAGSYAVVATVTDPNYTGTASGTLVIAQAAATVTLADLAQAYDANPKPATATTDPASLAVAITYDGGATPPTDAGSYAVEAAVTDPNYAGSASGTLVIAQAAATVTLANLAQAYDGDPKPATATTDPEGLAVTVTYDGNSTAPTDAGSYAVVATITDPNYTGSASSTLVVAQATATVTLTDLAQTYDGDPKPATATTDPEGLAVTVTYDGNSTAPTDAGSYALVATVTDPNYTGSASGTLLIAQAAATVTLADLAQTYNGNPKPITATTDPAGLAVTTTYDGGATAPTDAGSYTVVATVTDLNYAGSATGTLGISPAAATVTLADLTQTYDGDPKLVTATTDPEGLAVTITYDAGATAPTDAGNYAVVANVTDPNYHGSATGTLVVSKATATVTLANLSQTYDGSPKPATATTDPEGLAVSITYDGGTAAPTAPGSYALETTVTDPNYTGSASGTLLIEASYASWMETFQIPAPGVLLDSDGDGWPNLAEYLFDTNPLVHSSTPSVTSTRDTNTFQLHLSPNPVTRPDAILGAETSTDLLIWTTEGITEFADGFSISDGDLRRFMKLTFTLSP